MCGHLIGEYDQKTNKMVEKILHKQTESLNKSQSKISHTNDIQRTKFTKSITQRAINTCFSHTQNLKQVILVILSVLEVLEKQLR